MARMPTNSMALFQQGCCWSTCSFRRQTLVFQIPTPPLHRYPQDQHA